MLRSDHELRLSAAVQSRYRACGDDAVSKEAVTRAVQRQVARDAGFAGCVADGVELLQSCMSLFPGDEEMRGAAFYLKNNINVPCPLSAGSPVPSELVLHELTPSARHADTGRPCTLVQLISRAPLTVLCAGSAT